MKKLFSQITSYFIAASLVTSPLLAQAQQQTRGSIRPVPQKYRDNFVKDRNYMANLGYDVRWDHAGRRGLVYDSETKELVMDMPYTSDAELRKHSPSRVESEWVIAMAKLAAEQAADSKAWQKTKDTAALVKNSTKASFVHTYKRLPTESAMFFMAMGAVAAGQLVLDYSQNPIAFHQHIEHQLSPLGVIGFGSFMLTQGIASNIMGAYFGNTKLKYMIPYLGMTAGFFVQSYLSQMLADPNVIVCAKSMMGMKPTQRDFELGATENACDAAYEYLIVKKQLWILAPGLASMLLSSAAAAALQKGAQMGAAKAAGGSFKAVMTGLNTMNQTGRVVSTGVKSLRWLELAVLLTPGQMQVKGIRAVIVHGLQITAFVALDAWFNRWVTAAWKNAFDGMALENTNESLVENINAMKQANWDGDEKPLVENLKEFKTQMADWRMMNMASVYEAHQNWSTALDKMTGTYNAAKSFYIDFADQVRNSRYNLQAQKPLEQIYPLKGVIADGLPEDQVDQYFTFPKNLEQQQVDTVKKAVGYLELKSIDDNSKINPTEKAALKKMIADLNAGLKAYSPERGYFLGRALYEFNRARYTLSQSRSQTQEFMQILDIATQIMGRPDPMLAPGRGYMTMYAAAPVNAEKLKGAQFDHSKHQVGIFAAPTLTDKFVMQMICGPDANNGEMLTKDKYGFQSTFTPPRLHANKVDLSVICTMSNNVKLDHADTFYTRDVKATDGKTYRGYLQYLMANPVAGAIGDAEKSTTEDWWNRTTESQVKAAYENYGRSYNQIVSEMLEAMHRPDRAMMNMGPISNGIAASIEEQQDIYYTMLSDLLHPTKSAFSVKFGMQKTRTRMLPQLAKVKSEFDKLFSMIEAIKVVPAGQMPDFEGKVRCDGPVDYVRIESNLENTDIDAQVQAVQLAIANVGKAMGMNQKPAAGGMMAAPTMEELDAEPVAEVAQVVTLNKQQTAYATEILEGLDALAQEYSTYARIANAVTWDKIQNTKLNAAEQKAFQDKVDKQRSRLTPGR